MDKSRQYAAMMLDKLKHLDSSTQLGYYEMGRILSAIYKDKLYDVLGYESFKHMVEEELSYSVTTAYKYRLTYERFRELGYNKNEALQLINDFGHTNMARVLPEITHKIGKRAIKARLDAMTEHYMNFKVQDVDYEWVLAVFTDFGAVYSEHGRMLNATEVFRNIVDTAARAQVKKVA